MKTVTRRTIIEEAQRIRKEIEQIFIDCAHWNQSVRKPNESEINSDPNREMESLGLAIDAMLVSEGQKSKVTCPKCGSGAIQKINGKYTRCLNCRK